MPLTTSHVSLTDRLAAALRRACPVVAGVSYFYGYWFSQHRRA